MTLKLLAAEKVEMAVLRHQSEETGSFCIPANGNHFKKIYISRFLVPTYYRRGEGVLFIVTADWFLSLVKTCLRT